MALNDDKSISLTNLREYNEMAFGQLVSLAQNKSSIKMDESEYLISTQTYSVTDGEVAAITIPAATKYILINFKKHSGINGITDSNGNVSDAHMADKKLYLTSSETYLDDLDANQSLIITSLDYKSTTILDDTSDTSDVTLFLQGYGECIVSCYLNYNEVRWAHIYAWLGNNF